MDAVTRVPEPFNEPVLDYAVGSPERARLSDAIVELRKEQHELPAVIDGRRTMPSGESFSVVEPHAHRQILGTSAMATVADAEQAVSAAVRAGREWRELPYDERAAVFLRAADLLAGPWRMRLNAATMLGQSKTVVQAEIDAACELIDFWRYNVHFGREVLAEQPVANTPGVWNRMDHRPLEGFVYAVTPFNFTAIAGNLPAAPALMGNAVVWKPAHTQLLAASLTMQVLEEAGLPPGVINLLPGNGIDVSSVVLAHPDLAGIHFTGSTATFRKLWTGVAGNLSGYRSYPRLVGETGGKDFVLAHASADRDRLRVALVRGAFEYQGQKCSAASRAYVARSVWSEIREQFLADVDGLSMGPVDDFSNFLGAVIDDRAFAKHRAVLERAASTPTIEVAAGGTCDDTEGWFVRPTVLVCDDPMDEIFRDEYFGPILAVHVFDDADYDRIVDLVDSSTGYGLTGAVFATDRHVIDATSRRLRFAAGNFYVNDKPTGAVVGQQAFGGARASGTNDKAGSAQNLRRWISTRVVKENFLAPTDHHYPSTAT